MGAMTFFWNHKHWKIRIRQLHDQILHLSHELHHVKDDVRQIETKLNEHLWEWKELKEEIRRLARRIEELESLADRVARLEEEVMTGITDNPELHAYFAGKIGSEVRVDTASATLQGVVLTVAEDAVELRESGGDLLIIPFSRITSVQ